MDVLAHIIPVVITTIVTGILSFVVGYASGVRKVARAEHAAIKALTVSQILDDYDKYVKHGDEHTLTMARHANICKLAESYKVLEPSDETYKKYTDTLIAQVPEMVE